MASPSILSASVSVASSLLSAARGRYSQYSIGLSWRARQMNEQYLSSLESGYNSLFSLATGPSVTTEGLQTQIKGLRASLPESQIAPSLRGSNVDTTA